MVLLGCRVPPVLICWQHFIGFCVFMAGKLALWSIDDEEQHSENQLHAMMEVESGTIVTDLYVAYETSEPSI